MVISETQESNQVDLSSLPENFSLGAIVVNVNDHAYAKVRYDAASEQWLIDNLHTVADHVTRATVWRNFWLMVMDRKMSSLKYVEFVQKQLPHENIDIIIDVALMNLRVLIANYIPVEEVAEKKNVMFGTLLTLMTKEGVPKDSIVDQLFGFLSSEDNLRMAVEWLKQCKITLDGQDIFNLLPKHKHTILRVIFKSRIFDLETKMALLEETLGDDKSDLASNCRTSCLAGLPDPEVKARIWSEITDPNNSDSNYVRGAKMGSFYAADQLDIVEPYFDKFFDILPEMHEQMTHKAFEGFFYSMLPRLAVRDSHIVRLVTLLQDTPDTQKMFAETLRDGIDLLVRTQTIRAFAIRAKL